MMAQTSQATTWLNNILSGITAASGVGYLATAYSISRWLTRASHSTLEPPPALKDVAWEQLACTTADGVPLAGWVATPPAPRGTVALFHGMRGNRTQTLLRTAFLTQAGWRCVAFDHRAHGLSGGKVTSFGWFEARDVTAVTELIQARWPYEPKAALGLSMGAAALCFAHASTAPYSAFIIENVYHDLASAFRNRVGVGYPIWFSRFSRGAVWITEKRLGVSIAQVTPADYIGKLAPRPVLLLTGSVDPHAPVEEVERLFERCAEPREFHVVAGAGHKNVDQIGGRKYEELILGFLERNTSVPYLRDRASNCSDSRSSQ